MKVLKVLGVVVVFFAGFVLGCLLPDGPAKVDGIVLDDEQVTAVRSIREHRARTEKNTGPSMADQYAERVAQIKEQTKMIKAIKDPEERRAMFEAAFPNRATITDSIPKEDDK